MTVFLRAVGCASLATVLAGSAAFAVQQRPDSATQTTPSPAPQPRGRGQDRPTDPTVPTTVTTNLPGHPSPPQPQQQQGLDYFAGTWSFTWVGRESPITAGPRSGTAAFSRVGQSNFMTVQFEGTVDGGGPFKDGGVIGWNPDRKILVVSEKTPAGAEMLSIGDWSSPIGIRFDAQPLRVDGKTIRLRRSYSIVSATSFTVTEELSTDDGPLVRLGVGTFTKSK